MSSFELAESIYQNLQKTLALPGRELSVKKVSSSKLPFWIKEVVDIYSLPFESDITVQLVIPKNELPFDDTLNALKVIGKFLNGPVLLLADSFQGKTHGPLVRMKIPFITSQGTLFAPHLGLRLTNAFSNKKDAELEAHRLSVSHLGVKLIAAHLLAVPWAIKSFNNLQDLKNQFFKIGYSVSRMSLSRALNQIADLGMINISGLGPKKTYRFPDREELWRLLTRANVDGLTKKAFSEYLPPKENFPWVKSGESALEIFTELAQGATTTIAIKLDIYNKWVEQKRPGQIVRSSDSNKFIIEIWKSDPCLLSMDGSLNEVELALSMRSTSEPRVKMAIKSMLERHQLNADELWKEHE